jgi:hypothetical protein
VVHKKEELRIQSKRIQETTSHSGNFEFDFWGRGDKSLRWKQGVKNTHNLQSTEGEIGQGTKRKRGREIHSLSSTWGGRSQDTKRRRRSEGNSRPVKRRRRGRSGYQDKARERRALTDCQVQTKGQVRTPRETKRTTSTHFLSSADRETSQDTKTKRESEGNLLAVERG